MRSTASGRPRVLLAITVYNGRSFVPRTLQSAMAMRRSLVDVDVLFLDDASPDVAFSRELAERCAAEGAGHYRTPRNLGIVRNVNVGLLRALEVDYDFVVVSNSDVIYPVSFAEQMVRVLEADPTIGAAMAWSNNVSIYSIPNADPDRHLADQELVSALSEDLTYEFSTRSVDIPAGISFAMAIRREALEQIGLMDPIFGRGYCEETDWSRRCILAGWRLVLVPSVFVYHAGQGSTLDAGLVASGETTVQQNERIIDHRYPSFRAEVDAFIHAGTMPGLWSRAVRRILRGQAERHGLAVDVSTTERPEQSEPGAVRVRIDTTPGDVGLYVWHRGFALNLPLPDGDAAVDAIADLFPGIVPEGVLLLDPTPPSRRAAQSFASAGRPVVERTSYPERV